MVDPPLEPLLTDQPAPLSLSMGCILTMVDLLPWSVGSGDIMTLVPFGKVVIMEDMGILELD